MHRGFAGHQRIHADQRLHVRALGRRRCGEDGQRERDDRSGQRLRAA
jgi:hypothetical protein